jgi:hypothetical protein
MVNLIPKKKEWAGNKLLFKILQVDAAADAFAMLASGISIPTFTPPDMSGVSRFGFA